MIWLLKVNVKIDVGLKIEIENKRKISTWNINTDLAYHIVVKVQLSRNFTLNTRDSEVNHLMNC